MSAEKLPAAAANADTLVLFDFDGTLTTRDCFIDFVKSVTPTWRLRLGQWVLLPVVVLLKAGLMSNNSARAMLVRFALTGLSKAQLDVAGAHYANHVIPDVLRRSIMAELIAHREKGHRVVVVSASLDHYLKPWCEQQGIELLCSQLAFAGDRCLGRYLGEQCGGEHKPVAVKSLIRNHPYAHITAFGDTADDYPMLAMADQAYLRGSPVEVEG